jgi:outer membrane protein OmpA-like peptidoglycan-associated protein
VQLQAVHVRGQIGDDPAEFWFLDDVANPLSLRWSMGEGGKKLQVVKLSFPPEALTTGGKPETSTAATPAAPARIEHELATEGRAIVYGIYFDFASDRIKAESEPVLAEIAGVMNHNASWSLSLEGHTDGIGGATSNLDLSKRRAAAVKQALTLRYKIAATRLQTNGYGASRPKDTNATLEGRARNRRVELVKI